MILNVALFVIGAAWLQQQAVLPPALWTYALVPLVAGFALLPRGPRRAEVVRRLAAAALSFCCGFLWAALVAHIKLADRLPEEWEGLDVAVVGVVADLPQASDRGLRFQLDVENVRTALARVPRRIMLNWYPSADAAQPAIRAGERWSLTVRLRRPHGLANPNGFDTEAWLLERGIRATGYVRPDPGNRMLDSLAWQPLYAVARAREHIRTRIFEALPAHASAGVLVALAIGDQQSISRSQWTVYTRTGVNHLISVLYSGTH